jgi:hypothetical protein
MSWSSLEFSNDDYIKDYAKYSMYQFFKISHHQNYNMCAYMVNFGISKFLVH